jgi:Bacterial inner membrane protein
MQRMLAVLAANPAADGAGLLAMVCFVAWPLFQARSIMLIAYIGNNLCFALHYALLGHWTAVAMNGLMGAQTVVVIMLVRQPRLRWAYYALMPVLTFASAVTWQGVPSFLAAAATTLSTIGRMQTNDVILRVLLLAATPLWVVHDLIVGSFPGLIADVLSMATGATMLLRHSLCADRSDPRPMEGSREPRQFLQRATTRARPRLNHGGRTVSDQ